MVTVRVPLAQYSYIEYEFAGTPIEAIKEVQDKMDAYKQSLEGLKIGLEPKELARVMNTYLISNSMVLDDVEQLGTAKIYSQKDMFNLIRLAIAKITRDNK